MGSLLRRLIPPRPGELVVFFDGVCNLCNGAVDLLLRLDRGERLRFAPLQGVTARRELGAQPPGPPASIVVRDGERTYVRSAAARRIGAALGGGWRLLAAMVAVLPRPL